MKNRKLPNLITTLVLTLITAVMWVSFDVYRALTQKPLPEVSEEISKPLVPSLDADAINQIESRIFLNDSEIPEGVVVAPTPTTPVSTLPPEETPTPSEASGAAEPEL